MSASPLFTTNSGGRIRTSDLRVMGTESEVFTTLFELAIYVFLFVAQGFNEIVMLTMVTMMITDFATFCYSPVRMRAESLPTPQMLGDASPFPSR